MLLKNKKYYILLFLLLVLFFNTNRVFSATIDFSPSSSVYRVGDLIKIKVNISSDQPVNAVSGKVFFSDEVISFVSLSKSSSILNLWPRGSSLMKHNNYIFFEGVILSGFVGHNGNIATLVFKAKKTGETMLKFSDVSILANDGKGTNVFSDNLPIAKILIKEREDMSLKEKTIQKLEEKNEKTDKVCTIYNNSFIDYSMITIYFFIFLIVAFFIYLLVKKINNKKL